MAASDSNPNGNFRYILDFLGDLRRTHTCGQLRASDAGTRAILMGWVHRRRDLGGVIFIHLRDREGVTQIVFHRMSTAKCTARAEQMRSEYVIAVEGRVEKRTPETINPNIATGEVEVVAEKIWILNESRTPPFPMEDTVDVSEDARLKYRYVDLRRPRMQRNIILRSKITFAVREYLDTAGLPGDRDAVHDAVHAGRRARLPGAQPRAARELLRAAAIAADFQAAADGRRLRQVFPDRALLPRRGPARRPAAGVHADRPGDVVPAAGADLRGDRAAGAAGLRGGRVQTSMPFPRLTYAEAMRSLRQRQAGPAACRRCIRWTICSPDEL